MSQAAEDDEEEKSATAVKDADDAAATDDDDVDEGIRILSVRDGGGDAGSSSSRTTTPDDDDDDGPPKFYGRLHASYVRRTVAEYESKDSLEGAMTEHLRLSGLYWSLTAVSILLPSQRDVDVAMGVLTTTTTTTIASKPNQPRNPVLIDFVLDCFDERSGGFGGNVGQDGHLLYTLSAVQILALFDCLGGGDEYQGDDDNRDGIHRDDDDHYRTRRPRPVRKLSRQRRRRVVDFVTKLQQPDGSFVGGYDSYDSNGNCIIEGGVAEIDTRFSYCALQTLALLGSLHEVDVDRAVDYLVSCRNKMDGGFGCVPGAESHAGQVFCCVGALAIAKSLHRLFDDGDDDGGSDLLAWWLSERQCDSGGLNGRPEKQADVCYSWWILSALSILGKVSWIDTYKLASFILRCQDVDDGGIADRPDDMPDVFHTFFGIAGLSLLGYLHNIGSNDDVGVGDTGQQQHQHPTASFREIDPIYALPTEVVKRMKLPGQVLCRKGQPVPDRLAHYDVLYQ